MQEYNTSPCVPKVTGYSFATRMEPYFGAGGDLYGFHQLPTGETLVFVADVGGRGILGAIGAGMVAGMFTMSAKYCGADLGNMVKEINSEYCLHASRLSDFTTLTAVALDPKIHRVRCVNAAHVPAILRRHDGSLRYLVDPNQSGVPIGMEESEYQEVAIELNPGDMVFMCTAGVPEASNAQRTTIYGLDRLKTILARLEPDPENVVNVIMADVRAFTGEPALMDCATIVCFSRHA